MHATFMNLLLKDLVKHLVWIYQVGITKIDLVGKEQILHGKVYVRPLSGEDYLDLQVGVPVAISPMGFRWYDVYLQQIIGLHIGVWSLGRCKILQGDDTKVGLHMEDYRKAGMA